MPETRYNSFASEAMKVKDARKPTFRNMWNIENKDDWKEFNNMIAINNNKQQISQERYEEAEKKE